MEPERRDAPFCGPAGLSGITAGLLLGRANRDTVSERSDTAGYKRL